MTFVGGGGGGGAGALVLVVVVVMAGTRREYDLSVYRYRDALILLSTHHTLWNNREQLGNGSLALQPKLLCFVFLFKESVILSQLDLPHIYHLDELRGEVQALTVPADGTIHLETLADIDVAFTAAVVGHVIFLADLLLRQSLLQVHLP